MSVAATFCATLVDEWARAGVRHAAIAPGSRSTPLTLALAAGGPIRTHVFLDERSAAFFALGVGLATGVPAVVVTTSGTAAAELHAAVVEAHHAGVPLLAVTADRPPELRDVGAPQTVDQTRLFGSAARWFADPGVPDAAAAATWRSLASRAVAEALAGGPVHLNLPFREPLVGEPGELPRGRDGGAPWHAPVRPARGAVPAGALAPLARAGRGVIVAGRGAGDAGAVHDLAARTGWPVLADPLSGARLPRPHTVAAFDALLRHEGFARAHRPDVVLRLGAPPASKVLAQWLAGLDAVQVQVAARPAWPDPERTAHVVVDADPAAVCAAVDGRPDRAWAAAWARAEASAQAAIDQVLGDHRGLTEPGIARGLVGALAAGTRLVVSSSMPVRDVEWFAAPRDGVTVVANRGANGIDGVVSTALGVAAGAGATVALVGDLAFLHDAGGLLGARDRALDCTFVVVDNDGGGIFSFLPQAGAVDAARFERFFATPHGIDLAALAAAHRIPVTELHGADELAPALAGAAGVRVVLARTDRRANVAVHRELQEAVAACLG